MHESGKEPCNGLGLYYIGEFLPAPDEPLDFTNFIYLDGERVAPNESVQCAECGRDMTKILPADIKELQ